MSFTLGMITGDVLQDFVWIIAFSISISTLDYKLRRKLLIRYLALTGYLTYTLILLYAKVVLSIRFFPYHSLEIAVIAILLLLPAAVSMLHE